LKIALLGSTGMLGSRMAQELTRRNHQVLAPVREAVDLTRPLLLEKFFRENDFEVLINCSGYTRVDYCEDPSQFPIAQAVNGAGVAWLARFCRQKGRFLVHYSSDYVFDGAKEEPYDETDPPHPLSAYGRTKWEGERLLRIEGPGHYIIRTSWLYGPGSRKNFVTSMIDIFKTRPKAEVVSDQVGAPTYAPDLAGFTLELVERRAPSGTFHFANSGFASWFDFASAIQSKTGLTQCRLVPASTDIVFRPASRPPNSRFNLSKAEGVLGKPIRPWSEALDEYLKKELGIETA
jgi:dTDP-4-dehydrorhamnose reductase